MTFALDMKAFAKKTDARLNAVVKVIVLDVAKSLIEMSPVGDADYWKSPPPKGYVGGRFKGSWMFETGQAPVGDPGTIDASGSTSLNRVLVGLSVGRAAGKMHYIANNVPYAMRLENGGPGGSGWSRQAPQGMAGLTAMKFGSIVRNAARGMA